MTTKTLGSDSATKASASLDVARLLDVQAVAVMCGCSPRHMMATPANNHGLKCCGEIARFYVRRGQSALLARLLNADTATADDVRDAVKLPPDIDPVCLGAIPSDLARAGIIERVGYRPSTRPDAHARPVSIWRLRDRTAAECWLDEHPDIEAQYKNEPKQLHLPGLEDVT